MYWLLLHLTSAVFLSNTICSVTFFFNISYISSDSLELRYLHALFFYLGNFSEWGFIHFKSESADGEVPDGQPMQSGRRLLDLYSRHLLGPEEAPSGLGQLTLERLGVQGGCASL